MACVKSVKYRGLRQGDPLLPYLFLLVAEGLSCMLKGAEERGELEGVKVCREASVISLLLFTNDSLILMHANKKNADCLSDILNRYCANSGKKVSEAKSSIYFSSNTEVDVKIEVYEVLNIMTESLSDKYLGLLVMVGADRRIFYFLAIFSEKNSQICPWRYDFKIWTLSSTP